MITLVHLTSDNFHVAIRIDYPLQKLHIRSLLLKGLRGNVRLIKDDFPAISMRIVAAAIKLHGLAAVSFSVDPPIENVYSIVTVRAGKVPALCIKSRHHGRFAIDFDGAFFRFTRAIPRSVRRDETPTGRPKAPDVAPTKERELIKLGGVMRHLRAYIADARAYSVRGSTAPERAHLEADRMPHSVLYRMTSTASRAYFDAAISKLLANGQIQKRTYGAAIVYEAQD